MLFNIFLQKCVKTQNTYLISQAFSQTSIDTQKRCRVWALKDCMYGKMY